MSTILIVDDERGIREGLAIAVERAGHRALPASGLATARTVLARERPDLVLLDLRLRDGDGLDLLREIGAAVPVIVATAYGDSDRTIAAMRDGAFEYVTKPFDLPVLLAAIERALKQRTVAKALPEPPVAPRDALVGSSAAMLAVWKVIGRAAASDAPVLVTGEAGTGKELVARAIHAYSPRASAPFVPITPAELPGDLAFAANGGTVFLDDVGDLDAAAQARLLRVLSDETPPARARIIAATRKPAKPRDPSAALREDLYYRLAVFEIEVPPLRARRSDVPLLAQRALAGTRARAVSEDAMELLLAYDWPGNVRELVHVVQRAAAMCAGEVIDRDALPDHVRTRPRTATRSLEGLPLREAISAVERELIEAALRRAGGNRSEAARQLGISRPHLYDKIEEYDLAETSGPREGSLLVRSRRDRQWARRRAAS